MRRNYPAKTTSYRNWDRVYVDLPQCPMYSRLVCDPLKTIYINRAADPDIAVPRMFRSVEDFEEFCWRFGV